MALRGIALHGDALSEEALDHARHIRQDAPGVGAAVLRTRERPRSRRQADLRLVRAAQAGEAEALEQLFRRHWRAAHRAAFLVVHDSAAAEDIAQEAFLAALRALDRFDRRRPFAPWLHRIAINRAIDFARARALRQEVGCEPPSLAADPPRQEVLSDAVTAALAELDVEHRAVVVLRYLLDYPPGEIAQMLALPRGTVNSRLRRALDRLGVELEEERP